MIDDNRLYWTGMAPAAPERVGMDRKDEELGYSLKRLYMARRTVVDGVLRQVGLTSAQWWGLRLLSTHASLSNAELARIAGCTPQTMYDLVIHLESAGLVEREPHPTHGAIITVAITPSGRSAVEEANRLVATVDERMLAGIPDDQRKLLHELIRRCTTNLEAGTLVAPRSVSTPDHW
jgi:DNA-binding MarR family transcriptional regulator